MIHLDTDVFVVWAFINKNLKELIHIKHGWVALQILIPNICEIYCNNWITIIILSHLTCKSCLCINRYNWVNTFDLFLCPLESPKLIGSMNLTWQARCQFCRCFIIVKSVTIVAFGLRVSHTKIELHICIDIDWNEATDSRGGLSRCSKATSSSLCCQCQKLLTDSLLFIPCRRISKSSWSELFLILFILISHKRVLSLRSVALRLFKCQIVRLKRYSAHF